MVECNRQDSVTGLSFLEPARLQLYPRSESLSCEGVNPGAVLPDAQDTSSVGGFRFMKYEPRYTEECQLLLKPYRSQNPYEGECFLCLGVVAPAVIHLGVYDADDDEERLGTFCERCSSLSSDEQMRIFQIRVQAVAFALYELSYSAYLGKQIADEAQAGKIDVAELYKFADYLKNADQGTHAETDLIASYRLPATVNRVSKNQGFVYFIGSPEGYCKIGRAARLHSRLAQIQLQLPFRVELLHSIEVPDAVQAERWLHHRFAAARMNGEWFLLSQTDLDYIKSLKPSVFLIPPPQNTGD